MARVYVQHRQVVVPGDLLAEDDGVTVETPTYIERVGKRLYARIIGLVNITTEEKKVRIGIIPLEGVYMPKVGDIVIGVVKDIGSYILNNTYHYIANFRHINTFERYYANSHLLFLCSNVYKSYDSSIQPLPNTLNISWRFHCHSIILG